MNYLISGATGDVGSKVVELLLQRGKRPRIFARDRKKAHGMFGDRVDVFVGDLAEPSSLAPALTDVEAFYLVNAGPEIPQRDEAAAQLARAAGVKRLVKLSSMDVQHGLAIGAWHERGEAAIRLRGRTRSNKKAWFVHPLARGSEPSSTRRISLPFPSRLCFLIDSSASVYRSPGRRLSASGKQRRLSATRSTGR
jgi:uncharacterized protein YbjT (DUF2867 family)